MGGLCVRLTTSSPSVSRLSTKCMSLEFSQLYEPSGTVIWIGLPLRVNFILKMSRMCLNHEETITKDWRKSIDEEIGKFCCLPILYIFEWSR
jgi:hypothetical protein